MDKSEVKCAWCGEPLMVLNTQIRYKRKHGGAFYCDMTCSNRHLAFRKYGQVGRRKVMFQCMVCGEVVLRNVNKWNEGIRKGYGQVCGYSCRVRYGKHKQRYSGKRMVPRLADPYHKKRTGKIDEG